MGDPPTPGVIFAAYRFILILLRANIDPHEIEQALQKPFSARPMIGEVVISAIIIEAHAMPSRVPPSGNRSPDSTLIYVFNKLPSTLSSTILSKRILRCRYRLRLRKGGSASAVRYDGRFWPIYDPDTFPKKSKEWVAEGDTVYDHDGSPLKLPLKHPYLFICDTPFGFYR